MFFEFGVGPAGHFPRHIQMNLDLWESNVVRTMHELKLTFMQYDGWFKMKDRVPY